MAKKNKVPPMAALLLADDKRISEPSGPKGILVRLWRKILIDMNMMPGRFNNLMNDFSVDALPGDLGSQKAHTTLRGNLTKEFTRNSMTWPVFLKALRFVKFRKIRFIVQVYHPNGEVVEHYTDVDLGAREDLNQFLDLIDQDDEDDEQEQDNEQATER